MSNSEHLNKLISFGQYVHWADINFNRYICENGTMTENIAIAFQWFASMYVVIEGWRSLGITNKEIDTLIQENKEGVELLRRARNAVYHYQNSPLDNRLSEFATHYGESTWLAQLHQAFLKYLKTYPSVVCGSREDLLLEMESSFYEAIGWKPCPL